jgi:hypothetical protein
MKSALLPVLGLVGIFLTAVAYGDTNTTRRISVAEVEWIRLEVEQPLFQNEVQIRVRDGVASNRLKETVSCDIFYVADNGKEHKLTSVTLIREPSSSDVYSGTCSKRQEFSHGNITKVVYKSPGLRLPISTWYALYYH